MSLSPLADLRSALRGKSGAVFIVLMAWSAAFQPEIVSAQNAVSTGTKAGFRMYYPGSNDWWLDPSKGNFDIRANGGSPLATLSALGYLGIGTTAPANKLQIGSMGSSGYGGNDLAIGNGSQVMALYQLPTASMFYTNTAFSFMPSGAGSSGNVGIGTASPSSPLHARSGAPGVYVISAESVNGQPGLFGGYITLPDGVSRTLAFAASYDNNVSRNGNLSVLSNGTNKIVLDANSANSSYFNAGNVGIGTTAPIEALDIGGAFRANGHVTHTAPFHVSMPAGPWTPGYLKLVTPIGQGEGSMFQIKITGYRYGIGGKMLEAQCGGYAYAGSGTLIQNDCYAQGTGDPVGMGVENGKVVITIGSSSFGVWYSDVFFFEYNGDVAHRAEDFQWVPVSNAAPAFASTHNVVVNDSAGTITTTGNVGIGTANPADKLHVAGNVRLDNGNALRSAGGNIVIAAGAAGSSTQGIFFEDYAFATNFGAWFGNGNLVVGASSDDGSGAKLQVSGTVKATSFVGNGSGLTGVTASALASGYANLTTQQTLSSPQCVPGLSVTLTMNGGYALMGFSCGAIPAAYGHEFAFGVQNNGAFFDGGSSTLGFLKMQGGYGNPYQNVSFTHLSQSTMSGSQTFCVYAYPYGSTVYVNPNYGGGQPSQSCQFWVKEIK